MAAGVALALILAMGVGGPAASDTGTAVSSAIDAGPRLESLRVGVDAGLDDGDGDTVRVRRRAVHLSEAYHTRLAIHKYSSYAMLPTFAYMYAAGQQLMTKGRNAPGWAVHGHGIGAGVVAGLFAVNTYTGALNWWETRDQESGRTWRTAHAALMLLSDVGFTVVGQLATPAQNSVDKRRLHKTLALTSISLASVSYVMMLKPFRRD